MEPMPVISFTDLSLRKLGKPKLGQVVYFDKNLPSFGLRISHGGTKSFVLMYRHKGKRKRITIGRYPNISLLDARRIAKQHLADITLGNNPRDDNRANLTVSEAVDYFDRLHCIPNNRERTRYETMRLLNRHLIPKLGTHLVADVNTADISALLDSMLDTPTEATKLYARLSKFFNWCVERSYIDTSPVARLKRPARLNSRERVLNDGELNAVRKAAHTLGHPFGSIVELLLLTAQRRSEVGTMRFADLANETWTIPGELNKSGRAHVVPLSRQARDVIANVPRHNDSEFLFPARRAPERAFSGYSKSKRKVDALSGVTDWRLHDIRRTVATKMAELGVSTIVVEKILNHTSGSLGGVAGIYNRFSYQPEMRAALAQWADYLDAL